MDRLITSKYSLRMLATLQIPDADWLQTPAVDETTWPESGAQRWLWVNATEKATIFKLLAGRSQSEAREVIGSDYAVIATTDRFGAYNWLGHRRRQERSASDCSIRSGRSSAFGIKCVMGC